MAINLSRHSGYDLYHSCNMSTGNRRFTHTSNFLVSCIFQNEHVLFPCTILSVSFLQWSTVLPVRKEQELEMLFRWWFQGFKSSNCRILVIRLYKSTLNLYFISEGAFLLVFFENMRSHIYEPLFLTLLYIRQQYLDGAR